MDIGQAIVTQLQARGPTAGEFIAVQAGSFAGKKLDEQVAVIGGSNATMAKDAGLVIGVIVVNAIQEMVDAPAGKSVAGYVSQLLTGMFAASVAK